MTRLLRTLPIICFVLIIVAAITDPLQQLKITAADAEQYVLNTITGGNLSYPSTANAVSPQLRAEVAKGIAEFTKSYVQSEHFKSQYEEWWKSMEPQKPATVAERTKEMEEQAASDKARSEQDVENMKKQIAEAKDPTLKKALEDALKQFEQIRKQMDTPEMKAMMEQAKAAQKQSLEMEAQTDAENYTKDHAAWLTRKNPNVVIKQLLQQYLALVNTVDFNAATHKNAYGRTVFTDPVNEAKSSDWKMCFRAGKEVNSVTKDFAQRWLTELK